MRRIAVALAVAMSACGSGGEKAELTVAAAMSLKEAFVEVERGFEAAHPGVDVVFNFASSQVLAAQIVAGAPVDVFAAADQAQIDRAAATGRLQPAQVFAKNRLVIVTPAGATVVRSPADLARPGLRLVLAGAGVPAGAYARAALAELGVREAALANLVSSEDHVRGVVARVAAGEADVGVVYATDVTDAVADRLHVIPFAGAGDIVPTYAIAVVSDSPRPALAAEFVAFVRGPAGAAALQRRGFLPP